MEWVYRVFGKFLSETVPFAVSFLLMRTCLMWLLELTIRPEPDLWQRHWERFYALHSDPQFYFLMGSYVVSNGVYWIWGGFYCLLDYTGWLSRYKVQPGTNQPPDRAQFAKVRFFQKTRHKLYIGQLLLPRALSEFSSTKLLLGFPLHGWHSLLVTIWVHSGCPLKRSRNCHPFMR
jgi:transposase InsO family protein